MIHRPHGSETGVLGRSRGRSECLAQAIGRLVERLKLKPETHTLSPTGRRDAALDSSDDRKRFRRPFAPRSVVLEFGRIEEVVGGRSGLGSLVNSRSDLVLVQIGDIASGENARYIRLLIRVDDNVSALVP